MEPVRVRSASVQCRGGELRQLDLSTPKIVQHLTPHASEVLVLPLEVAQQLLQTRATRWQALSVVPSTVTTTHDGSTGLDVWDVATAPIYGVDTDTGLPYYDDAGVLGADVAQVTVTGSVVTFEGGYGHKEPVFAMQLQTRAPRWRSKGYERTDVGVTIDGEGNGHVVLPKGAKGVTAHAGLQAHSHPNLALGVRRTKQGVTVRVSGAASYHHLNGPIRVVLRYWRPI